MIFLFHEIFNMLILYMENFTYHYLHFLDLLNRYFNALLFILYRHYMDFDRAVNIDKCDHMKSNKNKRKVDDAILFNGGKWNETISAFKRFKREQVKPIAQSSSTLPRLVITRAQNLLHGK